MENIKFKKGDKAIYEGKEYDIISIDFKEELLALDDTDTEIFWVRYENVTLLDKSSESEIKMNL